MLLDDDNIYIKARGTDNRAGVLATYSLESINSYRSNSVPEARLFNDSLCRVIIPDHSSLVRLMSFKEIPTNDQKALQFLRWRLQKELEAGAESYEIAMGALDRRSGTCPCLVIQKNVADKVSQIIESLHVVPTAVMPMSFFIHKHLLERQERQRDFVMPSVLVRLLPGHWSILVTRKDGQIRLLRSARWRENQEKIEDLRDLYADCLRLKKYLSDEIANPIVGIYGDVALIDSFQKCGNGAEPEIAVLEDLSLDIEAIASAYVDQFLDIVLHSED